MSALSDLYPLVRQRCAGVIDIMMDDALRDAYRAFCEKSEFVSHDFKLTKLTPAKKETLTPPLGYSILKIESIETGKEKHLNVGDDYSFNPITQELKVNANQDSLAVVAILKPKVSFDPSSVNEYLIDNFSEALAAGAAKSLRMQVGTKWYNPELAQFYEREFVEGYREAYRLRRDSFNTFHNKQRKHSFY
ncbi:hypothetical protein LC147_12005 [Vibrio harveyi]|uniref:hypothetical protein n=1 Tax=Vibrio harveyi TaxID=669 RepID=UPI003BB6B4DD